MPVIVASRQIHLDFHTGPDVPDVGRDFDARAFARTMKRANVNSVTVFAKCHHGLLYYPTKRAEHHPGLKPALDLLGDQIEALHVEGIRAPIYLSVQCDEYAANTHPEWVARKADSGQVKWGDGVFKPGWQILDMSTAYQDYLADQTAEVLRRFKPVDGIFFDMCWDQPSTTRPFIDGMRSAGLDPEDAAQRQRHARTVAHAYMRRFSQMVKAASRNASVYFNGRKLHDLAEEVRFQEQIEIEALPTGGWGYLFFPKNVRFARTFAKPYLGMTARFHKSWADFGGLKPQAALEYETAQMLAHGARCSIGDQLHPRGTLDRGAYQLIGGVYDRVAAREPWCLDATSVAEIGLFQVPTGPEVGIARTSGTDEGAVRMLAQLKLQFDVVVASSALERYRLIILPDCIRIDAALGKRLAAYVRAGGCVLATGSSGLAVDGAGAWDALGVGLVGLSPFQHTYLRFGPGIDREVPPSDHILYDKGWQVRPRPGTRAFGRVIEPYFDRRWDHFCSHQQTPGATVTRWPIATLRTLGKGCIGYIPFAVFSAFNSHGNYPYRLLVRNLLDHLLPDPLVRIVAPTGTEVTVMRQKRGPDHAARTVVHLLHYSPERRTEKLDIVEDVVPLHDLDLSLALAKKPRRCYLAPEVKDLHFAWNNGRVHLTVPEVVGHALVVFE